MTFLIPAAQYIRMSSEHQQYSLKNQAAGISEYASSHGFTITKTYSDAARSGVVLQHRQGLMQLLRDVISGDQKYQAILVYDVSRWGRFQDTDESAHYEFLCKSAGVPVRYCAEPFENDGTLASSVLKALKRSMAGEFSRELGVRVYEGKKIISQLGFSVGGRTPYGFRRKIVAEDNHRSRILEEGERKNVRSERLILVPGPAKEVQCVREIFRKVLQARMTPREIARDLNARGITLREKRWTKAQVHSMLTNPVYTGCCIWGRSSRRLGGVLIQLDSQQWILKPDAFKAIVKKLDFDRVQRILPQDSGRTFWTRKRVLKAARHLLKKEGRLTNRIFDETPEAPSSTTLRQFGSFADFCKCVGYQLPSQYVARSNAIKHTFQLYQKLASTFADQFPADVSALPGKRPKLLLDNRLVVSLLICLAFRRPNGKPRWTVIPVPSERKNITLVCLLNATNTAALSFLIFPRISLFGKHRFGDDDPWLGGGKRLEQISQFCEFVRMAASRPC